MNSTDTETVADVLAEMRDAATSADAWRAGMAANVVMDYADRVETAAQRERDHAVEHTTRHAEAVARDNCRDCVHNPRGKNFEGGNAAAMREALVAVKKSIDGIGESSLDCDPTILMAALTQVCARLSARIERALAAPPRNCDKMPDIDNLTMHDLANSPCKSTLECASREELLALVRWLLAPAPERKGEGDGSK